MDRRLADYIFDEIENDKFFLSHFEKLLVDYTNSIFGKTELVYSNDYRSLLRYADMMSLSENETYQNTSQRIAILLSVLFPNNQEIRIFKQNIYKNVSNFASANMLESKMEEKEQLELLREIEIETHRVCNNIPGTDNQYFDAQRVVLNSISSNQYYSFSAPTSMGKTFMITNYIHKKLVNGCDDNFVIVVPTRALLSEIANKIINDYTDVLGIGKHKVVTTIASVANKEKIIAVLTPERLYYSLLKQPEISYKYIFIDEAHKISDNDKRSIIYYKILDMLKTLPDVHIYFSSPIIPNPDVYLELTNYYSQPENQSQGQAITFSPVIQNKIYLDFTNRSYSIVNDFNKSLVNCGTIPINIKDNMSALIALGRNKCNLIYVSSANKAIKFAHQLSKINYCSTKDNNFQSELEKVAKYIETKIHKEYFLADLIRKRVAYHIGALPAEIRSKIEYLIRKGIIKYCFCTSTLLEGVNVPVDNLFVFDHKKARSKMSEIDAFNLMGRAGRVTLNEYGNVFLFVENNSVKKYYDNVLLNPLPTQKLLPSKILSPKIKKYIVSILLEGKTNLLAMGEKYADKGFTETTYEYSTKCLNMLLHDICNHNDSYVVRDFRKDNSLTPQNIIDIRNTFKDIVDKDDDIDISARQKESLYRAVKNSDINYPATFEYHTCLNFIRNLSNIFQWNIYERETLGKGNKIEYYTVILTQWMQGKGLHEIIRAAIKHYEDTRGQLVSYEPNYHLVKYDGSPTHKNQVINEVMKDIEQIINYKFSMYFLRLSETIIKIKGEEALINDWYEYVEYGTNNNYVIILQKYGFLREEAIELLKGTYAGYVFKCNQKIQIKKDIICIATDELLNDINTIMINYPELFID